MSAYIMCTATDLQVHMFMYCLHPVVPRIPEGPRRD